MSDQIILKSRIPLKCYVWLKKRKDSAIIFQNFSSYSPSNNTFSPSNIPMISQHWDDVLKLLHKTFGENFGWYDISVISEVEKGHSFWFSGTFTALLSTVLFIASKELDHIILKKYTDFLVSPFFEKIFLLAWQLEFTFKNGNSIGQTIMTTLQNNPDPSFYCCEHFEQKITSLDDLKNIKYWYAPLTEKLKWTLISSEIPLDYYIVFSGISANTKHIEQYKEADKRDIDKLSDFMMNQIFTEDMQTGNIQPKKTLETIAPHSQMNDSLSIFNMMTIWFFEKLFKSGYDSGTTEQFIEHINNLRHFISFIEKQSPFAEDFREYFIKNRKSATEIVGIIPGYSGKHGWGYVVIARSGISRDTFTKTISDMKILYPSIEVEYSSVTDGESWDGIILEQYLSESLFSSYIKKGTMAYQNNQWDSYIGDYRAILENESTGLLIDTIERKIYFNGEKLNSKDIPSQSTTVDVLEVLIKNSGEDIDNTKFPASSYTMNKNEMLGKIVIPLVRYIEEKTGIVLPFICKGGISNFYLKLTATELKIGIIMKI